MGQRRVPDIVAAEKWCILVNAMDLVEIIWALHAHTRTHMRTRTHQRTCPHTGTHTPHTYTHTHPPTHTHNTLGALRRAPGQEPWHVVGDLYIWDSSTPLGGPSAGRGHWTCSLQSSRTVGLLNLAV